MRAIPKTAPSLYFGGKKPVQPLQLTQEVGILLMAKKGIRGMMVMWSTQGKGIVCQGPKGFQPAAEAALKEAYGKAFKKTDTGYQLKGLPLTFETGDAPVLH